MKKLFYLLILIGTATSLAAFYVFSNDGFGKGDIGPFAMLTSILSVLSVLLTPLLTRLFAKVNLILGFVISIVISVIQSILFTLLVWWYMGPWIGAFSFPIQTCWAIGALFANLYLLVRSDNKFKLKHLLKASTFVGIVFIAYHLTIFIKDQLSHDQTYDILCLVHYPSNPTNTAYSDLIKIGLTDKEANEILKLNISGKIWTDKFFRISKSKLISTDYPEYDFEKIEDIPGADIEFQFGNTLDSITLLDNKIIIVMNHPLEENFEFNEPLNSSIIVVQDSVGNSFKVKRFEDETNSKKMIIRKTDFRAFPYSTPIILNLKGNNEFRIHGFQWLKK